MGIQQLFNTTKKDIESKKYNIFIPICLGNKFFTKKNTKKYLLWAIDHTKDKVLVLIADKIQAINYDVRNNNTEEYNKK